MENTDKRRRFLVNLLYCAAILAIVTCSLLFAQHPSIRSIGLSTLIGMATTILISYSLQPFVFRQALKIPFYRRSIEKKNNATENR